MLQVIYNDSYLPGPQPVRDQRVILGHDDTLEITIDLDKLLSGRLLIQGPSGSGKSTLLRHLISQCAQHVQWLAIDPEGEYLDQASIVSRSQYKRGPNDAVWVRSNKVSCVFDISEMSREQQLIYLTEFIHGLVGVRQELWKQRCLVVVDEVEIFTPSDTSAFDDPGVGKRSRSALVELMSRGRKRGLIACIATHRLAQLAPSVRAEARNLLIGGSSFDVDIHRAADTLGWSQRRALDIIPHLPVGCFVACGPAFSQSPVIVKVPAP